MFSQIQIICLGGSLLIINMVYFENFIFVILQVANSLNGRYNLTFLLFYFLKEFLQSYFYVLNFMDSCLCFFHVLMGKSYFNSL